MHGTRTVTIFVPTRVAPTPAVYLISLPPMMGSRKAKSEKLACMLQDGPSGYRYHDHSYRGYSRDSGEAELIVSLISESRV